MTTTTSTDHKARVITSHPPILEDRVFHVRCNRCCASSVIPINEDTVRIICSSCFRRLTLPATLRATCPSCHATEEYPHTVAGHSTTCLSCGRPITLGAIVGKAEPKYRKAVTPAPTRSPHRHAHPLPEHHTFAFSEGAERSLILLAAAIATLIFVVAASMR